MQIALRRLRKFARQGAAEELDVMEQFGKQPSKVF